MPHLHCLPVSNSPDSPALLNANCLTTNNREGTAVETSQVCLLFTSSTFSVLMLIELASSLLSYFFRRLDNQPSLLLPTSNPTYRWAPSAHEIALHLAQSTMYQVPTQPAIQLTRRLAPAISLKDLNFSPTAYYSVMRLAR
jgi:hypothetical protein